MRVPVRIVKKPWGREIWYAAGPHYAGKILVINKGHRLSLQYHKVKHETVYSLEGRVRIEINGRARLHGPGSAYEVKPGTRHRFSAPYEKVVLLEVSTPELEDIVRIHDDYGRAR